MKPNLTKSLLIVFILNIQLLASTYQWYATINKTTAVTNEAIHLKYICEFSDRGELYTIDFDPIGNHEKYTIVLLTEDELLKDGKRVNYYEFIAYPKVEGKLNFDFDIGMKKTTQESINYTTKSRDDDRDNEDFTLSVFHQTSLFVDVKNSNTNLVGDFQLKVKNSETTISAFEPYHLEITIRGLGNMESISALDYKIEGVKVFAQKPTLKASLTKDGKNGIWSQKFAFVGEKDFTIPKKTISFYSLDEKKVKNLTIDEIKLELKTIYKKDELLDEEEQSYKFSFDFLYYILTFIAGFLVAKVNISKNKTSKNDTFNEKVQNAESIKELSMLLATRNDNQKYKELLYLIDNNKITSLKKVKETIEHL